MNVDEITVAATSAARSGDGATLARIIAKTTEFGNRLRHAKPHPITYAATPEVAMLLLPFARQRDLLEAIRHGLLVSKRPEVVKTFIEQGRSRLGTALQDGHIWLDQWRGGTSALHEAARFGCNEVLAYLPSLRPNLEAKGRHETTALGLAVQWLHVQVVQTLLTAGADPNMGVAWIRDCDQSRTIARLLLDAGARTTANAGMLLTLLPQDEWQQVLAQAAPASTWPHHQVTIAFEVVDPQFAQSLLKAGADPAAATVGALRNANGDLIRLVAGTLGELSPHGFTRLVAKPDVLQEALADGLDVNARNEAGRTLLTVAATRLACARPGVRKGLRRSIDILLKAGAGGSGRVGRSSPLRGFLDIASDSHANRLRWLLLRGLRDPLALHHCLRAGIESSPKLVGILLRFGVSPNTRDSLGRTPLHLLVANKKLGNAGEHLELLLDAGADPTLKDKNEDTPLDIALRAKQSPIVAALRAERRRNQASAMRETVISVQNTPRPKPQRMRL